MGDVVGADGRKDMRRIDDEQRGRPGRRVEDSVRVRLVGGVAISVSGTRGRPVQPAVLTRSGH